MIESYYEEEMHSLNEGLRSFNPAHPQRARRLSMDAASDRDPSVERLCEGFARIAAGIRMRIDTARSAFALRLIDTLRPGGRCDIPSLCVASFESRLPEMFHIPAAAEVLSAAAGPAATVCRFTLCRSLTGLPVSLAELQHERTESKGSLLKLVFAVHPAAVLPAGSFFSLQLYIDTDRSAALCLHHLLCHEALSVDLCADGGPALTLPAASAIHPEGFEVEDLLLPSVIPDPFSLLREYFAIPEKFLFVSLQGFEKLSWEGPAPKTISVAIHLREQIPDDIILSTATFRLHCGLLLNLFEHDLEPGLADGRRCTVPLKTGASLSGEVQLHTLLSVTAVDRRDGTRTLIPPRGIGIAQESSWSIVPSAATAGAVPLLDIQRPPLRSDGSLREESLSMRALCHNGRIPREHLAAGAVSRPGRAFPADVRVLSVSRPFGGAWHPTGSSDEWDAVAFAALGLSSFSRLEVLQQALMHADFSPTGRGRVLAEALRSVSSTAVMIPLLGVLLPGTQVLLTMDAAVFTGMHDEHVFGRVLYALYNSLAPLNHPLTLSLGLLPKAEMLTYGPSTAGGAAPWI